MRRDEFLKKAMTGAAGLAALNKGVASGNAYEGKRVDKGRTRNLWDADWKFHLGELTGAHRPSYNSQTWRTLDLPHDWSIEGDYSKDHPSSWRGGYLPAGVGWYRKKFDWNSDWEDKKVYIDFDGIYMNSDVWINGHHLGHRPYGYISFRYDLTPHLKKSGNVIAVRADNSKQPSCRWYSGSGIYRHVWLTVTNPVHIAHWGTYITTPQIEEKKACVLIQTKIENNSEVVQDLTVQQRIKDSNGKLVAGTDDNIVLKSGRPRELKQDVIVSDPERWSPDHPYLYEVETLLIKEGEVLDRYHSPLGIRTLEFSAESGFKINGKPTLIKGVCNHHDAGPVGAAVPDDVLYRRLKLLKEMGCNAVRTSHNPQSPEFYDFCDQLGLMVMDEAFDGWGTPKAEQDYGHYFDEWWQQDLKDFIKRDRNHPSIIIWSIGNEVPSFSEERQKELVDFIKNHDDTRPVTQGRGYRGKHIDIAGFNGHGELKGVLEDYHRKHPDQPLIGTEITHTNQTRGVYRTQTWYRARDYMAPWENENSWDRTKDKVFKVPDLTEEEVFKGIPRTYLSSYDNAFVRINVRDQFKHSRDFPFLLGTFRWTGFDYLGEAINRWPTRSSNFGIIDLAGIPKDHYYLYQSLWSDEPMVHLLPHWTHPGKEGAKIPVVAYTNCDSVELFLNDRSLGEKPMTDELQIVWNVPYQPGTLRAVAKNSEGDIAIESQRQTAGAPYGIRLSSDRTSMKANGRDVVRFVIEIVDINGVVVPQADHKVQFEIEGPGHLIGVENGDIADLDPCKGNFRKAFHGKCMALVQAGSKHGTIQMTARSQGLQKATAQIRVF